MNYLKFKIKKIMMVAVMLIVGILGINTVFATPAPLTPGASLSDTTLGFEAYNCSSYLSMVQCFAMIQNGSAATYKLSDGDSVDAGSKIILISRLDYTGTGISSINTRIDYNNDVIATEPIIGANFTNTNITDYPYFVDQVLDETTWQMKNVNTNKFTVAATTATNTNSKSPTVGKRQFSILIQPLQNWSTTPLNQHQRLVYFGIKVDADAPGGTTMPFSYGMQAEETDSSTPAGTSVLTNGETFTLKVSGGTTSSDKSLKTLITSSNGTNFAIDSTTPFLPGSDTNNTFLTYVPNSVEDIDISATANDAGAVITSELTDLNGAGNIFETEDNALQVGSNSFMFTVLALNGDTRIYTVNIYRLSNDATLSNLTASGISLTDAGNGKYTAIVPYSTTSTTISATTKHQNAKIASGTGSWNLTNSGATVNTRNVIVQAENCDTKYQSLTDNRCDSKTYTIEITRSSASENGDLSDLKTGFNAQTPTTITGFTKKGYTYNLGQVSYDTNSITISATPDDALSTIKSGVGTFPIQVGDNEFKVVVTDQALKDTEYSIKVHRKSNDTLLHDIIVTSSPSGTLNPSFIQSYEGRYKYTYDPSVTSVNVSATVNDLGKAYVAVVNATDGIPTSFQSTQTINTSSDTFNVPATTVAAVIVTSENGDVRTYYVDLERKTSVNNSLSLLTVQYEDGTTKTAALDPTFSSSNRTYSVTVPANITEVTITPTKATSYSKVIQIGSETGVDLTSATISGLDFGSKQIQIVVVSEAGVDNPYTLTIIRSKYNIATLDTLAFGDGVLDPLFTSANTSYEYKTTLNFEDTTLPISGKKTNQYATIDVTVIDEKNNTTTQTIIPGENNTFSGTLNIPTGENTVNVKVTAHDGTTVKEYKTKVVRKKNNDSSVNQIVVDGQTGPATFDAETNTYSVEIINTKTSLQPSEVGISVSSDASVTKGSSISGIKTTEPSDFTFTVTAENGDTTNYTLKVIRKKNTASALTRETITADGKTYYCDVTAGSKGCTIAVPTSTTSFTVASTISTGATVNPVDGTEFTMASTESTKDLTIIVTSEDESASTNYTITIERAKSSDDTLSDLQVDGVTVSGFTSSYNVYTNTQGGLTNKVTVKAVVNDIGKASVSAVTVGGNVVIPTGDIEDGIYTFDANLVYGDNRVIITVKAENEQVQNYTLTITRQRNTTATIERILIGVGDQEPTLIDDYQPSTASYTITETVPYDTSTIKLVAYPSDEEYGSAMITTVKNAANATTATNITNEYTDGEDNRYIGTVNLATGKNTIEVTGTAHNGTTKKYTIVITRDKNNDSSVQDLKVKGIDVTDEGNKVYSVTLPNNVTSINTATDITYTLGTSAKATFSPATKTLSTTGTNDIIMTVTAEDSSVSMYTIKITREKSTNVNISRVTLTVSSSDATYNGKSYYCLFDNTDSKACTIDVPASTTAFTVATTGGDLASGAASVFPVNGTEFLMPSTESTKDLKVTVTAEDEVTTQDYDITVRRMKSSNADLASLTVNGTSVANFQRGTQIYYYSVDGDTDYVTIGATVYDVGKSVIETDISSPFYVTFGLNTLTVKVRAEDETSTKSYTILLTRQTRKDATLSDIKIDGTSIKEMNITPAPYDKDNVFEYTIVDEYPYTKTSVNIEAIVNDQPNEAGQFGAHVTTGNGSNSLKTGTTDITIHVVAHDTTITKDYVLHINRKKNDSTALSTIVLDGNSASYDESEGVWEVTVPNSVTDATQSNLVITPAAGAVSNDQLATVVFADTTLSTTAPTNISIAITAEDGTTGTATLRVTREKSKVATLHSLNITASSPNDGSFNPSFVPDSKDDLVYTVTIPAAATSLRINATTTDPNATILTNLSNSFAITESETQYQVRVQSEDKSVTLIYELNIKRTSSNDNTLRKVTVTSGEGESLVTYDIYDSDASTPTIVLDGNYAATPHYKVTVPGNVDKVNISAITTDPRASIENADTLLGERTLEPNATLVVNMKVISEGGTNQTYTLSITRQPKTNNNLTQITVDNVPIADFDPDTLEYELSEVGNEISTLVINASKEDADAKITKGLGSWNLATGDNTLEIEVEAQDGTPKTYKLKVTRKKSDDNRLSALSVNGYQITPTYVYTTGEETHDYYVTVRYTKDTFSRGDVYALPHNNTATITYDETIALATGETKAFNVYVTSESGDLNTYTIHVTRSKSDNAYLSSLVVTSGSGAAASLSPTFSKTTENYTVSIPYGETTFEVLGTPEVESTSVQGNATYTVGEINEITITTYAEMYNPAGTPAEQAATKTYKLTIIQALSNNAYLSNLSVNGYPFVGSHTAFSQAYTTYDIGDIDYSVSGLVINAVAENGASRITYAVNGGIASTDNTVELPSAVGSGSITVTVTAPDGITKIPYTITFNKVYSTVTYLASLTSDAGTWDKTFIKTTTDYLLTVENSISEVNLTMYTESVLSNVNVNGEGDVSATNIKPYTYKVSNLPEGGDTAITILVTAQDPDKTKTYNVVIRRAKSAANSDATLQSLSTDDYPFVANGAYTATTFDRTTTDYSIGAIPYELDKIKLSYQTTQGESSTSIMVGGSTVIADSDGYITLPKENTTNGIITVLVVAPDGKTTKSYSIHYTKTASSNAFLSNLVVSDGTLTPAFEKNTTDYQVTLPDGVSMITITATKEDEKATLSVGGQERISPYAYTLSGLTAGTTKATFVVTAQNGSILTYYVDVISTGAAEVITSNTYGHVIADQMIKDIKPDLTGLDVKNQLDNDNSKLQIWTSDDTALVPDGDKIGTGMIAKLIVGGSELDRKKIVVLGDTDGSAEIDLWDAVLILNHYLGYSTLTDEYAVAGDVDISGDIDLWDAVVILNHYLGYSSI